MSQLQQSCTIYPIYISCTPEKRIISRVSFFSYQVIRKFEISSQVFTPGSLMKAEDKRLRYWWKHLKNMNEFTLASCVSKLRWKRCQRFIKFYLCFIFLVLLIIEILFERDALKRTVHLTYIQKDLISLYIKLFAPWAGTNRKMSGHNQLFKLMLMKSFMAHNKKAENIWLWVSQWVWTFRPRHSLIATVRYSSLPNTNFKYILKLFSYSLVLPGDN